MTTSTLGTVLSVVVVAAGLVVWITAVFRAEKHPETGRGGAPGARSPEGSSAVTRASRCRVAALRPR
jgi:hypothetical protein